MPQPVISPPTEAPVSALRLFAVLVGGKHPRALIELHDVQFVAASRVEDAVPILRQRWWGAPSSLHIDAYAEIDTLDGYRIELAPARDIERGELALYFVNTGGYVEGVFDEEHAYSFHIGADKREIWNAAKSRAPFAQKHQDNFDPIDDVVCVDDALTAQALRFIPAPGQRDNIKISAAYIKLGG